MSKPPTTRAKSKPKAPRGLDPALLDLTLAQLRDKFAAPGAPKPSKAVAEWLDCLARLEKLIALCAENDRREAELAAARGLR
jgi:hypothetical protein